MTMLTFQQWVTQLRKVEPNCSVVLMGCQSDMRYNEETLQYAVRYEEGLEAARRINAIVYLECSARTSAGINDLFEVLTKCAVLCDAHNTWKKSHLESKSYHTGKVQISPGDSSKFSTGIKKTSRFRNGLLATSWLTDKLAA